MDYQRLPLPIKGKVSKAFYCEQQIPSYKKNPLIEALPPFSRRNKQWKGLKHYLMQKKVH